MKRLKQIIVLVVLIFIAELVVAQEASENCRANYMYVQGSSNKVAFINKSLCDYTSCEWSFGDGNVATSENVVHEFKSPGYYLLRLVVSNGKQAGDTLYQIINVQSAADLNAPYAGTNANNENSFALSAKSKEALFGCFDRFFADAVLVTTTPTSKKRTVEESW